jgi:hypothetical protein
VRVERRWKESGVTGRKERMRVKRGWNEERNIPEYPFLFNS